MFWKWQKKPALKSALRTVGKEALNSSTELLLDSLKGSDANSGSNMSKAKARIVKSIETAKNAAKAKSKRGYHRLRDESDEDDGTVYPNPVHFPHNSSLYGQHRSSLRHVSSKKRKPNRIKKTSTVTRKRNKYGKTIFDWTVCFNCIMFIIFKIIILS